MKQRVKPRRAWATVSKCGRIKEVYTVLPRSEIVILDPEDEVVRVEIRKAKRRKRFG